MTRHHPIVLVFNNTKSFTFFLLKLYFKMSLRKYTSLSDIISAKSKSGSSASSSSSSGYNSKSGSLLSPQSYSDDYNSIDIYVTNDDCPEGIQDAQLRGIPKLKIDHFDSKNPADKIKCDDFVIFDAILNKLSDKKIGHSIKNDMKQILVDLFCCCKPTECLFIEGVYNSCNRKQMVSFIYMMQEIVISIFEWLDVVQNSYNEIRLGMLNKSNILATIDSTSDKIVATLLSKIDIHKEWLTTVFGDLKYDISHDSIIYYYTQIAQFILSSIFCLQTKIFVNIFKSFRITDVSLNPSLNWYTNMYALNLFAKCKYAREIYELKNTNVGDKSSFTNMTMSYLYINLKPHLLLVNYFVIRANLLSNFENQKTKDGTSTNDLNYSTHLPVQQGAKYSLEKRALAQKLKSLLHNFNWTLNWEIKCKFVYTWCKQVPDTATSQKSVANLSGHFRKLFSMTWFYIPPCIRRAIILVNKTHNRLSYKDQLKFCWFLFSAFFKPLLLNKNAVDENVLALITISLLKSLQEYTPSNNDDKYSDKHQKRFADIYRAKITAHRMGDTVNEKDKIAMFSCNTLAGLSAEENDLPSITTNTSRFRQISSKHSDKSHWTDSSTNIICPFSAKNKTVHGTTSEWDNIASIPVCLLTDVEDLGYVMSSVRPTPPDEPVHVKSALKKKFITDKLFSATIGTHLNVTCLSCNVDYCMKSKTQEISDQDIQATSEKKFTFKNPTDRFLQDVCLGVGQ